MKAVAVEGPGKLVLIEIPEPKAGPGEVVLKVSRCGICGSDLHMVEYGILSAGAIMGHEFGGTIVEVGQDVEGWKIGDAASVYPITGCGQCERCREGLGHLCPRQAGIGIGDLPGAYAEYVASPARCLVRSSANITGEQLALVEPLAVSHHGVLQAGAKGRAPALVIGAGPIGLLAVACAKNAGAEAVVASDFSERRRALAQALGADFTVVPDKDDPLKALSSKGFSPPQVIYECVGLPGLIGQAMDLAPRGADVIVLGVCIKPDTIFPVTALLKELTLRFCFGYSMKEFGEAMGMLAEKKIAGEQIVTDTIGLRDVPGMFETLKKPTRQAKVLIDPT